MIKKVLILATFALICSASSWGATCLQGATGCTSTTNRQCSSSSSSCAITVGATTAHKIGVICAAMDGNLTLSSTSDGGYTASTGSKGNDATLAGSVQCAYNLNETGGATTITCSFSSSSGQKNCAFFEFSPAATATFDVGGIQDDTTNCTSCAGVALSTTTSNTYMLVQIAYCGGTCSALNQSYSGFATTNGDWAAYKINAGGAGTTPNFTQSPSARLLAGAVAIYETSASPSSNMPPVIY